MQWCSNLEAMHKTGKDIEEEDLGGSRRLDPTRWRLDLFLAFGKVI